jgi:hypothetical protein
MDKVILEGLQVRALIGVHAWERRGPQPLLLDLALAFDNRRAAAADAIADTVDYQAVAERLGGRACFPRPALCTDNGAMIAFAGALRLQAGQHNPPKVDVTPRWDMATLPAV